MRISDWSSDVCSSDLADGGRFHIALDAGDLAGEAQARQRLQAQPGVEQARRIDEGVAMQAAEARELGVFQAGNGAADAGLLAVLQLGLEADDVVERAERIEIGRASCRERVCKYV